MMKYWDSPEVLSKLGRAMGDVMQLPEGEDGEWCARARTMHKCLVDVCVPG